MMEALLTAHKIKNRMANSVDLDGMARYEPSHLDVYCLQKFVLVYRIERVTIFTAQGAKRWILYITRP